MKWILKKNEKNREKRRRAFKCIIMYCKIVWCTIGFGKYFSLNTMYFSNNECRLFR